MDPVGVDIAMPRHDTLFAKKAFRFLRSSGLMGLYT